MIDLKPCPNPECRSERLEGRVAAGVATITCLKCHLRGPAASGGTEAIKKWNALPRAPKWTMYDGTKETLPKLDQECLIHTVQGVASSGLLSNEPAVPTWWIDSAGYFKTPTVGDKWMPWPGEE